MRLVLLILIILFAGCERKTTPPVDQAGELVVLTRTGTLTHSVDPTRGTAGFDHDLARMFARELGLKVRFIVAANDSDIRRRLKNGEAHLAAAWQVPSDDPELVSSTPYFQSRNVLVTHEASLPIAAIGQLANRTVDVVAGSRQESVLLEIKKGTPELIVATNPKRTELDLMEEIALRHKEAALVNNAVFDIGSNYYPELQSSLEIGQPQPIVWLFAPGTDIDLIAKANIFLQLIQSNGDLDRLKDRYFGHVERLKAIDSIRFIERMYSVLPRYLPMFLAAQAKTGIDWRLLAALAYQESHWDPLSTSPTGVRGIMMLTEETADELGLSNRLDPEQGIRGGAQYLSGLLDALPDSISNPDRMWFALAAYNVGMGHLNAARRIAKSLKIDPDTWYGMKKALPLLSRPQYYNRLKSGKGRGGEAVIMVENIRVYRDILIRYARQSGPLDDIARKAGVPKIGGGGSEPLPGLAELITP
jgi:membrane-bound lytic murein transglycosylase F